MSPSEPTVVLSFDVEEHDCIEAAAGLAVAPELRAAYRSRVVDATRWLLEELSTRALRATFFVVGRVAEHAPELARAIVAAGHELASHSHAHQSLRRLTPQAFRDDLRRSRESLERAGGVAIVGFRAPTFSLVRDTAWAIDILAEEGLRYDSSIYPVRHDRYGVPDAPRGAFRAIGQRHALLELPPATVRLGRLNVPVGGGGYFRLLPGPLFRAALARARRDPAARPIMLYFHPWEFDPGQPRLPLARTRRWRTYAGIARGRDRLRRLLDDLGGTATARAIDVASRLAPMATALPSFRLADSGRVPLPRGPRNEAS